MSSMSQLNSSSDASLEHCYTNIFALTDFSGIQYIKYVLKHQSEYQNALDDPIIKSYALCQKQSVLSAWVRSKPDTSDPHDPRSFSKYAKELWVFWYGNSTFPHSKNCILPELIEEDHGNWRQGLSYETRTVLFRALHNVVERCLLNKGFVRLGKWFVQPRKYGCNNDFAQYGISFSFFLHGESTVCASLDIRQNKVVQTMNIELVQKCTQSQSTVPVILAPYGISAELAGFAFDQRSEDELAAEHSAWLTFYPLRAGSEAENCLNGVTGLPSFVMATPTTQNARQQRFTNDKKRNMETTSRRPDVNPKFVEIIVNGHRMRYPICFVLIDGENDSLLQSFDHDPHVYNTSPGSNPTDSYTFDKYNAASLLSTKSSKSQLVWKSRKTKSRSVMQVTHSRSPRPEQLFSNNFLQSDFLLDCRRIFLARQTLKRASQHSYFSTTPNRSASGQSRKPIVAGRDVAAVTSIVGETTETSLVLNEPCFSSECRCNRSSRSSASVNHSIFHRQDSNLRNSLKDSIHPSYRPRSPPSMVNVNFSVGHDPSMPTLSPQQPAPAHGAVSNSNNSYMDKSSNEITSDIYTAEQNQALTNTNCGTSLPPSLVPKSEPNAQSCVVHPTKLPNGLVNADSSVSPNCSKLTKVAPHSTPILASVIRRKLTYDWLSSITNKEFHREPHNGIKKLMLSLALPDQIELELSNYNHLKQNSPSHANVNEDAVPKDSIFTNDDSISRTKRARTTLHQTDVYDYDQNENCVFSNSENFVNLNSTTPDIKVGAFELDAVDEEHGNFSAMDVNSHSGLSVSNGNVTNPTCPYSRTVGLIQHRGVSLASSTGSGPIGPAELALMLPTPPSHDAPQPSPVDGVVSTARSSVPTTVTVLNSSPTGQTSMDPVVTNPELHSFCLSSGSPQQYNQSSWNSHKVACAQNHVLQNMECQQDWSFVQPCAAYLGMTSNYQMPQDDIASFNKSLPQMKWSYDHRVSNSKLLTFMNSDNVVVTGQNPNHINTISTPCLKSWLSPLTSAASLLPTANSSQRPFSSVDTKPSPQHLNELTNTSNSTKSVKCTRHLNGYDSELQERLTSIREVDGLLVNLILSDSMMNLFKDHNFDSCNICECTSSVLGSEINVYLANPVTPSPVTKPMRANSTSFGGTDLIGGSGFHLNRSCKCGFSAVMNQKYAVNGNLFYEDEIEVTKLSVRPTSNLNQNLYSKMPNYSIRGGWWNNANSLPTNCLLLLQRSAASVFDEFCVRQLTDTLRNSRLSQYEQIKENRLEHDNACTLVAAAIENSVKFDNSIETGDDLHIKLSTNTDGAALVHPSFILKAGSKIPENQNDQIRLLATMRPWLQEAISSTRLLESNYTVDGPLTWKDFHQLAGRGSDETCKPQPIPQLRVSSCDHENLLISPFAIRDWERLSFYPLSRPKRIAYAVIIPSESETLMDLNSIDPFPCSNQNVHRQDEGYPSSKFVKGSSSADRPNRASLTPNFMIRTLSNFFRELSHTYENCHLGQHLPYYLPEISSPATAFIPAYTQAESLSFTEIENIVSPASELTEKFKNHSTSTESVLQLLQCYVSASVRCALANFRKNGICTAVSISNADASRDKTNTINSSTFFPPFNSKRSETSETTITKQEDDKKFHNINKSQKTRKMDVNSSTCPNNGQGALTTSLDTTSWGTSDAYLVIYLLNPFSYLCDNNPELMRSTMQALISCLDQIRTSLPESWHSRVITHILSLDCIMSDYLPRLRPMALALYTSVNRLIQPSLINANRTLTGIGPAAEKEAVSLERESHHRRTIFAPPYTLVGTRDLWGQWDVPTSELLDCSSVLFVAYCLTQDQHWLLATFTDEQGSLSEQALINIKVPTKFFKSTDNQYLMSPRRIGLARLWDYIISLISRTSNPWRLVVGRIGRLGHGELKGWNGLLGRKSLQDVNKFFRERCSTCNTSASVVSSSSVNSAGSGEAKAMLNLINTSSGTNSCTHELPCLISACLVSLEPQSTFRVYPGFGLCPDEPWTHGASGGGGGGGTGGIGLGGVSTTGCGGGAGVGGGVGGGGGGASTGTSGTFHGSSSSPFTMRMMMSILDNSSATDLPSATHILVFPTSTSASGLSEHDPPGFVEAMYGMGPDDINVFDWLLPTGNGLDDLDAPTGTTADMLDALNHTSALGFGLSGLGPSVCVTGMNDACCTGTGPGDASDALMGHGDYVPDDHGSNGVGLHGMESAGMIDFHPHGASGIGLSTGRLDDRISSGQNNLLNTMPFGIHDPTDEVASLMQQPLAMGYYISTAPAGPLPSWFWVACPHAKYQFPVCLKSALHLQTSLVGMDDAAAAPPPSTGSNGPGSSPNRPSHLLDSTSTCDVLRYVLEAYNALSWLSIDPTTNDRRTCLPVHILSLAQIYQAFEAFT